jgi:hypothetical protein
MTGTEPIDEPGSGEQSADSHPSPPATESDEPTFATPWQARAFALAVALTDEESEDRTWDAFQRELVAEIEADAPTDTGAVASGDGSDRADGRAEDQSRREDEDAYYRQWLRALERFLEDRGVVDAAALVARAREFESGDRDAHEFVDGDPHGHADELPEGHADGSHTHGHEHERSH